MYFVRDRGIEPLTRPWQGRILPLNHTRFAQLKHVILYLAISHVSILNRCAPARIRTWNNGSEDRCDIHFTTGAWLKTLLTDVMILHDK